MHPNDERMHLFVGSMRSNLEKVLFGRKILLHSNPLFHYYLDFYSFEAKQFSPRQKFLIFTCRNSIEWFRELEAFWNWHQYAQAQYRSPFQLMVKLRKVFSISIIYLWLKSRDKDWSWKKFWIAWFTRNSPSSEILRLLSKS